jgi:hypothetical protein
MVVSVGVLPYRSGEAPEEIAPSNDGLWVVEKMVWQWVVGVKEVLYPQGKIVGYLWCCFCGCCVSAKFVQKFLSPLCTSWTLVHVCDGFFFLAQNATVIVVGVDGLLDFAVCC